MIYKTDSGRYCVKSIAAKNHPDIMNTINAGVLVAFALY
nr:hypothetical protein [Mucilaginibacter sp. SP1R1]